MDYNAELLNAASAEKEDHERALRLIEKGANVNVKNSANLTPLHWAAYRGHYEIAKTLLEHGARIHTVEGYNWAPLTYAIEYDREKVVRLLLEKGANPNIKAGISGTALEYAIAENKNATIVELLIEHGANCNGVRGRRTPLHWACEKGYKKLVELLLDKGASVEIRDHNNQKPVDIAKNKGYQEIAELLENNFPMWLRLYHASKDGNYDECKELLERGALVGFRQNGLYCPVAAASKKGHANIVKLLLEKGARVNYKDDDKNNPVYLATKHGHKDIVSLLWNAERYVNYKVNGETLLHVATRCNHKDIVQLLIEKEVNPNSQDSEGYAPLHHAILYGNRIIVTHLLNANANVNLATNQMETPLHMACEGVDPHIVKLLLEKGANKDARNEQNEKPINVVGRIMWEKKSERMEDLLKLTKVRKRTYEMGVSSVRHSDMESDSSSETNEDTCSGDADSDAAVDSSKCKKLQNLTCEILNIADIVELNTKIAQLSSLISQLNEHAMNAKLVGSDLALETEILKKMDLKIRQVRGLKRLKSQDSKAQIVYQDNIVDLTRRMDKSKKKVAKLRLEIGKFQTEISHVKAGINIVYREIGRFIDKIKVAF